LLSLVVGQSYQHKKNSIIPKYGWGYGQKHSF
jgi:hypothetical protein